jgi:hypothetical protein
MPRNPRKCGASRATALGSQYVVELAAVTSAKPAAAIEGGQSGLKK